MVVKKTGRENMKVKEEEGTAEWGGVRRFWVRATAATNRDKHGGGGGLIVVD